MDNSTTQRRYFTLASHIVNKNNHTAYNSQDVTFSIILAYFFINGASSIDYHLMSSENKRIVHFGSLES